MFAKGSYVVRKGTVGLLQKRLCFNSSASTFARSFHSTPLAAKINIPAEQKCKELLEKLPNLEYIFQNEDGSKRIPSEGELKIIAFLNSYTKTRKLNWIELFTYPRHYKDLYLQNDQDLEKLKASSGLIIDKIPYEDTATGEIKWKIVRDNEEKEGWENIAHFLFIPAFCFLVVALCWRDDMNVTEWAKRELLYRVKSKAEKEGDTEALKTFEKFGDKPEGYDFDLAGFDKNDDVIVERILSGEYDKMAKLKVKQHQQRQK